MLRRLVACSLLITLNSCSSAGGRDDAATTTDTSSTAISTSTTTGTIAPTSATSVDPTSTTSDLPTSEGGETSTGSSTGSSGAPVYDLGGSFDLPAVPPPPPELWYSIEDMLVYIDIDKTTGAVNDLVIGDLLTNPSIGDQGNSCSLTMLADGSLLGGRGIAGETTIFHIPEPSRTGGDIEVNILGTMPDGIYIEALHTACDGRIYLMDSGEDSVNNVGNRLLRFTGDYLAGDLSYKVITDLEVAAAPDIDDMAPGIDAMGEVIDNPGFGIDSGTIYKLDYGTGTGDSLGMAGTYGIHALGGPMFDDGVSRLYVLTVDAEVYQVDPVTLELSPLLITGPALASGNSPGDTGFAGPLTECMTGFTPG